MKKKKRQAKRTYKPEFKASVVKRVLKGRANRTETQRAIADELGITETLVSTWVRNAQFDEEKAGLMKTPPPKAAPAGAVISEVEGPTLELHGLRSWVRHEVRLEVDRYLALKGIRK